MYITESKMTDFADERKEFMELVNEYQSDKTKTLADFFSEI